jgi:hypothetical protein
LGSSFQRARTLLHAQIVQTARHDHRGIREIIFGITQNIFDYTGTFDSRNRVFDADPHARDMLVLLFLGGRQFAVARLFFGW